MSTILFFGDSLTAGYGLSNPAKESFPSRIADKIRSAGLDYEVVNAGLSGDTSQGGLSRLDYWLSRPVDVFVLELGINDIRRGVSPTTIQTNLGLIIERVRVKNPSVRISLMGMQIPPIVTLKIVDDFRMIYVRLAEQYKISLMPFFLLGVMGVRNLNLSDGLHPSADGYRVISNNAWTVIRPLLGEPV